MALAALSGMEQMEALGIVARAALALGSDDLNPSSRPRIENELAVRLAVVRELRERLHVPADDDSPVTIEKLTDLLDKEADEISGPIDEEGAIARMSREGTIPCDLLEPEWGGNIPDPLKVLYNVEREYILETVRRPDIQEHYGPAHGEDRPSFVSLFARNYDMNSSRNACIFIVGGDRIGSRFFVGHAWRLYYSELSIRRTRCLSDYMEMFAGKFGESFAINGKARRYILCERFPSKSGALDVDILTHDSRVMLAGNYAFDGEAIEATFSFVINIRKYLNLLVSRRVIDREISHNILGNPAQHVIGSHMHLLRKDGNHFRLILGKTNDGADLR